MTKKFFIAAVVVLLASMGVSFGEGINWFAVANYLYYENGTTWLDGNTDNSLGCFAQLLWVGPNGTIDAAYGTGDGTQIGTSDDVVVDTWWVGAGVGGADGWFDGANIGAGGQIQSNRVYFGRVWSAPAANYASGLVPTSLTNRYANSATWTYHAIDPVADDFDIASAALSTTLTPQSAIPEPAVLGLAVIGLLSLRLSTRKKK